MRLTFAESSDGGNEVILCKKLSGGYGQNVLFSNLSFQINKGDRAFIIGANGCGKSTLIKLILSKLAPLDGKISFGYNIKVGYYDQENQNLTESKTVLDELWDAYPKMNERDVRSTLAAFLFSYADTQKQVSVLSGGERARLTLAKLVLSDNNCLVLDEPTNHLDINSREALEDALDAYGGTILCVSHDRYLINKLATRILQLNPEGFSAPMIETDVKPGNAYAEFAAFRDSRPEAASVKEAPSVQRTSQSKEDYLKSKQDAAEQRKQKNKIEKAKREQEKLEAELSEVEKNIEESQTDYVTLAALFERRDAIEERLLEIYEILEE
jgi:ATP-binding cassette subfamily F protein 3